MAEEKLVNIPLKSAWTNRARSKRANVTVSAIRNYFNKHFKISDVKISEGVNQVVWKRGSKKPPAKIQVKAIKDGETMNVLLPDEKLKPKEEKKGIKDKLLGRNKKAMTEEEKKEFEEFKEAKKEEPKSEPKVDSKEKPKETKPENTEKELSETDKKELEEFKASK